MSQNTGQAQIHIDKPQNTLQLKINASQCTLKNACEHKNEHVFVKAEPTYGEI